MTHPEMLVLALVLDAIIGDPKAIWSRLPHPVTMVGGAINGLDRMLNRGPAKRAGGIAAMVALCAVGAIFGHIAASWHWSIEVVLAAVLLAHKGLVDHVSAVASALTQSLPEARHQIAKIVGRDTGTLDETGVARAAIESAAENFSDGVVAPAFWFLLFGLPGILVYKIVNTADSMIGYQSAKYQQFGWAAAKLDDVLNWIPARFTAALIALTSLKMPAISAIGRDAAKHRSPNAGWPEAAMAVALDVALSGPRIYDGRKADEPFVHPSGRKELTANDVVRAVRALWRCWTGLVLILVVAVTALWLSGGVR